MPCTLRIDDCLQILQNCSTSVVQCALAGSGVVVHHTETEGLVLVDRNTVAISLGDVTLSFGAYPADTVARIRFLHPLHNFALLSYKTADLPPEVSSPQLWPQ